MKFSFDSIEHIFCEKNFILENYDLNFELIDFLKVRFLSTKMQNVISYM